MKTQRTVARILIAIAIYASWTMQVSAEIDVSPEEAVQADIDRFFGSVTDGLEQIHFFEMGIDDMQKALKQISAQQYTNLVLTSEFATRQFILTLFNPLRTILATNPCKRFVPCQYVQNYETWASISGSQAFVHGNGRKKGLRVSGYEIAGGIQATIFYQWTLGAALSYERDHANFKLGGFGRQNTYLAAIYGLYRGKRFYALFDGISGYSRDHIRRRVEVDVVHFSPHANPRVGQKAVYGEIGTDFAIDNTLFQPFIGIEWGHYHYHGFRESGGFPFAVTVKKNSLSTAYSYLGVHLVSPPLSCNFSMSLDLAWRYRFNRLSNDIHAELQHFGTLFKVKPLFLNRNSFEGTVRFSQILSKNLELFFDAYVQGWDNSTLYRFLAGVKSTW